MGLKIVTSSQANFYNFGPGTSWVTVTGSNIISVGVQTNNNQQSFSIVQMFVTNDGTSAYIQVANNNILGNIGWKWYAVQVYDDAEAATIAEVDAKYESLPKAE